MNYHSHVKTQYGQNIAAKCSYLSKDETQVISQVFFPLMHKTKMPAAWSLVEVRRPLKSPSFQDVLDYITYSITFPPPQSTKAASVSSMIPFDSWNSCRQTRTPRAVNTAHIWH